MGAHRHRHSSGRSLHRLRHPQGRHNGRFLGYVIAILSVIRWIMIPPVAPVMGLIHIVLYIIVLFGLSSNEPYFY